MSSFFLTFPAGAGESVREGGAILLSEPDGGVASPVAAEMEPNDLICFISAIVEGAAGDVDRVALVSSIDPNVTLFGFAGKGDTTFFPTATGSFKVEGDG